MTDLRMKWRWMVAHEENIVVDRRILDWTNETGRKDSNDLGNALSLLVNGTHQYTFWSNHALSLPVECRSLYARTINARHIHVWNRRIAWLEHSKLTIRKEVDGDRWLEDWEFWSMTIRTCSTVELCSCHQKRRVLKEQACRWPDSLYSSSLPRWVNEEPILYQYEGYILIQARLTKPSSRANDRMTQLTIQSVLSKGRGSISFRIRQRNSLPMANREWSNVERRNTSMTWFLRQWNLEHDCTTRDESDRFVLSFSTTMSDATIWRWSILSSRLKRRDVDMRYHLEREWLVSITRTNRRHPTRRDNDVWHFLELCHRYWLVCVRESIDWSNETFLPVVEKQWLVWFEDRSVAKSTTRRRRWQRPRLAGSSWIGESIFNPLTHRQEEHLEKQCSFPNH